MKQLRFSFKGTRTYVQGPDILNALVEALAIESRSVDLTMRSLCQTNVVGLAVSDFVSAPSGSIGQFEYEQSGETRRFSLLPLSMENETRVEFDETSVLEGCSYIESTKSVTLDQIKGLATDIETIVSLNKALHLRAFAGKQIKWLFVRFQANVWPINRSVGQWSIQLKEALGTRLTKSEVYLNEVPVGTIWFSGVVEKK